MLSSPLVTTTCLPLTRKGGGHIYSLDGLRGVAILMIFFHHHKLFPPGWMGVDIFFVLSGYLITSGLRKARSEPHFWKRFYVKRIARILPPCLLALLVCEVFYRPSHTSFALYLLTLADYAAASSRFAIPAILVLWSLAVEEHFYALQPFAIRYLRSKHCVALFVTILASEPILRAIFSSDHNAAYIYFFTPFRLDGLSAGALLALLLESQSGRMHAQRFASWYGIVIGAIALSLFINSPATFRHAANSRLFDSIGFSLVAFGSVALIAYVLTHPGSLISRVLRWRVLVFLGAISYGMYLYHLFFLEAARKLLGLSEHEAVAITLPLTILLCWLSYRFYERPLVFYGRKWLDSRRYMEDAPESRLPLTTSEA